MAAYHHVFPVPICVLPTTCHLLKLWLMETPVCLSPIFFARAPPRDRVAPPLALAIQLQNENRDDIASCDSPRNWAQPLPYPQIGRRCDIPQGRSADPVLQF